MANSYETTTEPTRTTHAGNGLMGPILVGGFGTGVLMWLAWYVSNFPGLEVSAMRVAVAMLVALVVGTGYAGFLAGPRIAGRVGLGAGALAGILDLLVLLANLVRQPSQGEAGTVHPNAALYVPGFIIGAAVAGAVCAFVAARILPRKSTFEMPPGHDPWLARFGLLTVVALAPLVIIGAGVTSTDSGLSVAGWPHSDGYLMFLYPIELMSNPRVFLEHGHRLFGFFAGLTFLALTVYVLRRDRRRAVKILAIVILVAIGVQAVLGGWRVLDGMRLLERSPYIAAFHAVLAQLIIGAAVSLAVALSASFKLGRASTDPAARRLRLVATGLTHSLIVQLALGALYRHLSAADPAPKGATHILYTHAGFSIVIVVMALLTGSFLILAAKRELGPRRVLRRCGTTMLASVMIQFALGWAAFFLVLSADRGAPPLPEELPEADPVPLAEALVTMAHQANGALLIAMAAIAFVWARRLCPRKR